MDSDKNVSEKESSERDVTVSVGVERWMHSFRFNSR